MIYSVFIKGDDTAIDDVGAVLSAKLDLELNTAGSLEFTIPWKHVWHDRFEAMATDVEVADKDGNVRWSGRVTSVSDDIWRNRTVYCEGALAYLNDSVQPEVEFESVSVHAFFSTLLANHNSAVGEARRIQAGRVTVTDKTVYRKLEHETTLQALKDFCVGAEGGYLFVRLIGGALYLDWLAAMETEGEQPVEFGLNMLSLKKAVDLSEVVTQVIPLGARDEETGQRLTVSSVNDGSDTITSEAAASYGKITRTVVYDEITDAAALLEAGTEYLSSLQFSGLSIECDAADLAMVGNRRYEDLWVGRMIYVVSDPHLLYMQLPISKMTVDLTRADKKVTVGTLKKQSLTEIVNRTKEEVSAAVNRTSGNSSSGSAGADSGVGTIKMADGTTMNLSYKDEDGLYTIGDRITGTGATFSFANGVRIICSSGNSYFRISFYFYETEDNVKSLPGGESGGQGPVSEWAIGTTASDPDNPRVFYRYADTYYWTSDSRSHKGGYWNAAVDSITTVMENNNITTPLEVELSYENERGR